MFRFQMPSGPGARDREMPEQQNGSNFVHSWGFAKPRVGDIPI